MYTNTDTEIEHLHINSDYANEEIVIPMIYF